MTKQKGFSLLEMLLSMALGLVVMAMVAKIFITVGNMNHRLSDEVFLQQNMRLALQILGNAIREAGSQSYPSRAYSLDETLRIQHLADGNDTIIINKNNAFEVRKSAYPDHHATKSLYDGIELVPGMDGLHATISKSDAGNRLVAIQLDMTAPGGMSQTAYAYFAIRVSAA
jgi:prepilin-type N-terminal cleavage/methylation domain-containing protein